MTYEPVIAFDSRNRSQPAMQRMAASILAILMVAATSPSFAQDQTAPRQEEQMKVRDLYPLITTPALFEARDFYQKHFGFSVLFEASWFVYLSGPGADGGRGATLAFMHPDHPSNPPGPEAFSGQGMILTVEVEDAEAVMNRVSSGGAPIVYPLTDEKWGQRRFMTRDPAGVLIDVVEQIEPAAGYWDAYPAPNQ